MNFHELKPNLINSCQNCRFANSIPIFPLTSNKLLIFTYFPFTILSRTLDADLNRDFSLAKYVYVYRSKF